MATATRPSLTRRRWLSFSLRALAIIVALSAAIVARYADQIRELWRGQPQIRTLRTAQELRAALQSPRAAIFHDVDWSIDCALSRRVFSQFAGHWQQDIDSPHVDFYRVDLTDGSSEVAQAIDEFGLRRTHGYGEVLWIVGGLPREYTLNPSLHSVTKFTAIARDALVLSPGVPQPQTVRTAVKAIP